MSMGMYKYKYIYIYITYIILALNLFLAQKAWDGFCSEIFIVNGRKSIECDEWNIWNSGILYNYIQYSIRYLMGVHGTIIGHKTRYTTGLNGNIQIGYGWKIVLFGSWKVGTINDMSLINYSIWCVSFSFGLSLVFFHMFWLFHFSSFVFLTLL